MERKYGSLVRGMRVMARVALAFLNRFVLRLGPRLPGDRVRMACAADLFHRRLQQVFLGRCMRIMAGEAALLAQERPMDPVPGEHAFYLTGMALGAQPVPGLFDL